MTPQDVLEGNHTLSMHSTSDIDLKYRKGQRIETETKQVMHYPYHETHNKGVYSLYVWK